MFHLDVMNNGGQFPQKCVYYPPKFMYMYTYAVFNGTELYTVLQFNNMKTTGAILLKFLNQTVWKIGFKAK